MARTRPHSSDAFPRTGGARDQDVGAVQPHQPRQPVFPPADFQRPQVGVGLDRGGRHHPGEGVAADELQQHRTRLSRPDPAQDRAEPVRQVVGDVGDLRGGLAGHQPDVHPVDVAGGADLDRAPAG